MSQICFYLDEDTLDNALIRSLRTANLDVVTVAEISRLGLSDGEQLLWATEQGRAIYSFNIGDFCKLHRDYMLQGQTHAGIILAQQRYSIGQQLQGLVRLATTQTASTIVNQLVFLSAYIDSI